MAGPARSSGATPLHHGYLASNPRLIAALAVSDTVLRMTRRRHDPPIPTAPRRVLLAVGGHLGDAVIATAAIEHLHRSLPDAELGIVMPSWSRVVLEGDQRLRWLHTIDHWKSNRSSISRLSRWRRYQLTRRSALREIRAVAYDVAVDLYGYFPNMALMLSQSMIPVRVGFASGGLGPLYTHAFPWTDDLRQVAERQVELVSMLTMPSVVASPVRYALPETVRGPAAAERVAAMLNERRLKPGAYIVMHPGTGAAHREWPVAEWRLLARRLAGEGHQLVFTGRGARESAMLSDLSEGVDGSTNLCDAIGWHELVEVIRQARLVITVESVAAHVAAAVATPCVALWSDTANARFWRPLGPHVALVTATHSAAAGAPAGGDTFASSPRATTQRDVWSAIRDMLAAGCGESAADPLQCDAPGAI